MHVSRLGLIWILLAVGTVSATPTSKPPANLGAYFDAARRADAIANDEERCLAYPDLPGNAWGPGAGAARCALLRRPAWTLGDVANRVRDANRQKEVDDHFASLMDAHYAVPKQREQIFVQYMVFDSSDEALRVATEWVRVAPESPWAKTALASVIVARAARERGNGLARDIPVSSVEAMSRLHATALATLRPVVRSNPRLLPACRALAVIGRIQGMQALMDQGIGICRRADPASFFVAQEWMAEAEPRWGGSEARMRGNAAEIARLAKRHPMLYSLSMNHLDANRVRSDDPGRVLRELGHLVQRAPNARMLRMTGNAFAKTGEPYLAVVHLSQALRYAPEYEYESARLARLLEQLGEPLWARRIKDHWAMANATKPR